MEEFLVLVFIGFIFGVCVLFGWYFIHQTKLKERILLAEKGIDINNLIPQEKPKNNWWLKVGIVAISASFGFLVALIIGSSGIFPRHYSDAMSLSTLFLFGGIGMVIAHYADRSKEHK